MMTDTSIVLIYTFLAVSAMAICLMTARKKKQNKLDKNMLLIGIMLFCWLVLEIAFYTSTNQTTGKLFFDLKLPFVSLVAFSWFYYAVSFFGLDKAFPKEAILALMIIPTFTFVLALTTNHHTFIREQFILFETSPMHVYENVRGPWFWYHSIYSYAMTIAAVFVTIFNYRKTPKGQRFPATLLLVAISIAVVANVLVVMTNLQIDVSLIGGSLTFVILYQATKNYQGIHFVFEAKRSAFNHITEAVFILDSDARIINSNKAAKEWIAEIDIALEEKNFAEILKKLALLSEKRIALNDVFTGTDYYLGTGRIYNVRQKYVLDKEGESIGCFAFIKDETDNRELIEYLDVHSGIDALTGLLNRRKLEEEMVACAKEKRLPLAIIFGDLNGLKQANDIYGHHQGDVLLRLASEALRSVCPPHASIGRYGGDEFVVVLRDYTDEEAERLCEMIRHYLSQENEKYPFDVSMALGYAVKHDEKMSLDELLTLSDSNMYLDKQRCKTKQL